MKRFGPIKAPPEIDEVDTPAGAICLWCEEPIAVGDSGYLIPYIDASGTTERAHHWECHIRSISGSVGHQRGTCSCHGGTEGDPPGVSKREAAKAAAHEFLLSSFE